jgi:hypothetical protein
LLMGCRLSGNSQAFMNAAKFETKGKKRGRENREGKGEWLKFPIAFHALHGNYWEFNRQEDYYFLF